MNLKLEVTLMNLATFKGHVEVMKALLDAGADIDESDKNGLTPLLLALYLYEYYYFANRLKLIAI